MVYLGVSSYDRKFLMQLLLKRMLSCMLYKIIECLLDQSAPFPTPSASVGRRHPRMSRNRAAFQSGESYSQHAAKGG